MSNLDNSHFQLLTNLVIAFIQTDKVMEVLFSPIVTKLAVIIGSFAVLVVIVRIVNNSIPSYIKDSDVRYRVRKMVSFIGYGVGLLILATIFSDKLGGLTVAFGVAGAGIAFALQEVIASFAGWFAISLANFYKPGDRIQLGGIKGDVIDIGILRTTLMEVGEWVKGDLYSGRVVRIANSFVFKEPVFNYSGDFPFLWDEITVPIKYGSNYNLAREIFYKVTGELLGVYAIEATKAWQEMTKDYLLEQVKLEPVITLVANDNWVEFTIRYVVDYKQRRVTKDKLFTKILEEVESTNNKVGFASMTVHLVETPTFDVRLKDSLKG